MAAMTTVLYIYFMNWPYWPIFIVCIVVFSGVMYLIMNLLSRKAIAEIEPYAEQHGYIESMIKDIPLSEAHNKVIALLDEGTDAFSCVSSETSINEEVFQHYPPSLVELMRRYQSIYLELSEIMIDRNAIHPLEANPRYLVLGESSDMEFILIIDRKEEVVCLIDSETEQLELDDCLPSIYHFMLLEAELLKISE